MASKKQSGQPVLFCRIENWVRAHDADFMAAIDSLCKGSALNYSGRTNGVTFLYPSDEAYRREIIDLAYSDDAAKAEAMIDALILPDVFLTGEDFKRRDASPGVGNRAGVRLHVKAASARSVELDGGVKLAPADDFKWLPRKAGAPGGPALAQKISVWLVKEGRLPVTGEAYTAPRPEPAPKRGGGPSDSGAGPSGSGSVRMRVFNDMMAAFAAAANANTLAAHDPALATTVSLLNWLRANRPELYAAAAPLFDYDWLICLYILLEPYKTAGEPMLPDADIAAWGGASLFTDASREWLSHFESMPSPPGNAAAVLARICESGLIDSGRALGANVAQIYAELESTGTLHWGEYEVAGYLPPATCRLLGGGRKAWQDERRCFLNVALMGCFREGCGTPGWVAGWEEVRRYMSLHPGNNYIGENDLVKSSLAADYALIGQPTLQLAKFVCSSDFAYCARPPAAVGVATGDAFDHSSAHWEFYNRMARACVAVQNHQGTKNETGLSAATMQELRHYVQVHGRLPQISGGCGPEPAEI